jgi:DNA-binding CsgD family transcriptional regulator
MTIGSCIIIHQSPVIQNGLNSILQTLKIEVREILLTCPDSGVIREWAGFIIFIDIKYLEFIQSNLRYLKKGNNVLIGLDFSESLISSADLFDETILKSTSQNEITTKIKKYIPAGESGFSGRLSSREREILKMVALGNSNKQIAASLFISIHTVITHRKNITMKLGIKSISGLTLYSVINNIV